jgi:hypothetical protein
LFSLLREFYFLAGDPPSLLPTDADLLAGDANLAAVEERLAATEANRFDTEARLLACVAKALPTLILSCASFDKGDKPDVLDFAIQSVDG